MIDAGELKKGIAITIDGQLYQVLDYQHIKMGRGSAQVRLRLRDVRGGHTTERVFQASEKFARAFLERLESPCIFAGSPGSWKLTASGFWGQELVACLLQ